MVMLRPGCGIRRETSGTPIVRCELMSRLPKLPLHFLTALPTDVERRAQCPPSAEGCAIPSMSAPCHGEVDRATSLSTTISVEPRTHGSALAS